MRISTKTFQLQWLAAINQQQYQLANIQRQISTGKRISTAADDPAGAAQMVLLQQGMDRLENYAANGDTARRRLSLEEGSLDKVVDTLDRVRELAIQAGGTAKSPEARAAIANESRELLKNLLDLANNQDGEGRYLFSGNRVGTQPFSMSGGIVSYFGDDGVRFQRVGDNRTIQENDFGSDVFQSIRNGNGTFSVESGSSNAGTAFYSSASVVNAAAWLPDSYSITFTAPDAYEVTDSGGTVIQSGAFAPGQAISFNGIAVSIEGQAATGDTFAVQPSQNQDIFTTVQNFITSLEAPLKNPSDHARAQSELNTALLDLDRGLDHIGVVRSRVGSRLAAIDEQDSNNQEVSFQLAETLGTIRDVDYPSAISQLEQQLFALEAAQKTFQASRSFSLFDIL